MNLKAFRKKHGLSTAAVVADLQEYFPKYTKATESMVENPGKYGIELSAKAVKILRDKYETPSGKDFLEFLFNTIQPNEMEQYISMYRSDRCRKEDDNTAEAVLMAEYARRKL